MPCRRTARAGGRLADYLTKPLTQRLRAAMAAVLPAWARQTGLLSCSARRRPGQAVAGGGQVGQQRGTVEGLAR
jgi:hypothetical protein